MRIALIVFVLIHLVSCQSNLEWQIDYLTDIIAQHFTEYPTSSQLLPICHADKWFENNMSTGYISGTNIEVPVPSPPPWDTVLYGNRTFQLLLSDSTLTKSEAEYMRSVITCGNQDIDLYLTRNTDVKVIHPSDIIPSKSVFQQFSMPLFNRSRTKVLISVNTYLATEGYGMLYVFQFRDNTWEEIHRDQTWIS